MLPEHREKHFKNACLCQVEMSRLRAVCCLPVMTEAISGILQVSFSFSVFRSPSARLRRALWCAGWRVHECVHWCFSMASVAHHSELLSVLIAEEAGLLDAETSVGVHQRPELWYGEFCGTQSGVHIRLLHHLLCQLHTTRLREQLSGGKKGRRRE